jgi:hypothetical protein
MISCNNYLIKYEVVDEKELLEGEVRHLVRVDLQDSLVFIEGYDELLVGRTYKVKLKAWIRKEYTG